MSDAMIDRPSMYLNNDASRCRLFRGFYLNENGFEIDLTLRSMQYCC